MKKPLTAKTFWKNEEIFYSKLSPSPPPPKDCHFQVTQRMPLGCWESQKIERRISKVTSGYIFWCFSNFFFLREKKVGCTSTTGIKIGVSKVHYMYFGRVEHQNMILGGKVIFWHFHEFFSQQPHKKMTNLALFFKCICCLRLEQQALVKIIFFFTESKTLILCLSKMLKNI